MGTWALSEAQALVRQNVELLVVSCTSWVPKLATVTSGAKAYSDCPETFIWPGSVRVLYPRWLYYPVNPIKTWAYQNPKPYLYIAWKSVKRELLKIISNFQPDLIFCHHLLPNGWIASQLSGKYRRPIISSDHDFDEITDCNRLPQRLSAMKTAVNACNLSLAVSNRMAKDLRHLFPNHCINTYHHGVDLPSADLASCPRPKVLQNKKIILTCALFSERKGIPLLVEAFCKISHSHPDAVLRIIGSGPEEANVLRAIEIFDKTKQVALLGKMKHNDVLQEMSWSDCFALVSWNEPLGQVYLEAMAAGKPILCCQDSGINDVFTHGVHGYAVPPKSVDATSKALSQLLSNNCKRIEMGDNARNLIENNLTWDSRSIQLVKLFDDVITS